MFQVPCSRFVFTVPCSRFVFTVPVLSFVVLLFVVPARSYAQDVEPVRAGLVAVPMPAPNELEPAVAEQLRAQRAAFAGVAGRANVSDRDLAAAYHALARLCHAYEFFDAAEASYANAIRLVPQEAASLHLLGYLYQQTGRYEEALVRYSAARRARPNDLAVRAHLADVYLQLNRLGDARQLFQELVDIFPAVARAGLGEIALREGRFDEAVQHLEAALARAPDAASVRYSLGMAYRGLGRLDQARSHLARRGTSTVRPADPVVDGLRTLLRGERAQMMLGRQAYEAGQFEAARAAFSKALEAAPSSAEARLGLGMALAQVDNAAGAIEQLEAALRLDADNTTAHTTLGLVLARVGRDRDAVDHLLRAFRRESTDETAGHLLRLLLKQGRSDEALDVFSRTRSLSADDEGTVLGLSILLADRQRYRDAIELLTSAERQFPDRVRTTTTLARLLAASPDRSLRDGARALALATRVYDAERSPAHAETMALALAELGRCAEAMTWMQRAIADADRTQASTTAVRLKSEAAKYAGAMCRP
jgi:tetratricopeptide (TPR) repeat protein